MRLKHQFDLGYCTNIHRGETWAETFDGLQQHTLAVKARVAPDSPYGIGLRLSAAAATELSTNTATLNHFKQWLEDHHCYVFTINGFPYGTFHGNRVKEQVFRPDWTDPDRLTYTQGLFDLLTLLAPEGEEISVSTLPGSFKSFIQPATSADQWNAVIQNLRTCSDHIERLRDQTGRDIHLGLEPEPLGLFENTAESLAFFERLVDGGTSSERERWLRNLGLNYDTCHFAVEYDEPEMAIPALLGAGIRISKLHLSSALRLVPSPEAIARLESFHDDVYLHQVIVAEEGAVSRRFMDLPDALKWQRENPADAGEEWRVHFHIPLHAEPDSVFGDTRDHISGVMKLLEADPSWCRHFEMETYTWEVMPENIRSANVVDQLEAEYEWCLGEFRRAGLA